MADISRQLRVLKRQEEEAQARRQAKTLGLSYINLSGYPFSEELLLKILPEDIKKYRAIPYLRVNNLIKVAVLSLPTPELTAFLSKVFGSLNFDFAICSPTSLQAGLLARAKALRRLKTKQRQPVKSVKETPPSIHTIQDLVGYLKEKNISRLLEIIFKAALNLRASDVHFEPEKSVCRIRFRIDGILHQAGQISLEQFKGVESRIKNLAHMKLDIRQRPQDGRFSLLLDRIKVDIRVASLPGAYGESLVLRFLRSDVRLLKLNELGFSRSVYRLIYEAIHQPNGMILNTGPTGSGKTTTLYAILNQLNRPEVKIITIEDPIEYQIPGISQTQINQESGYTFSTALASAVRQDPDIIMLGEIRDPETAKIALQAALTGHLVLSTLHTNTASAAIPRLLDMGIEPYLLAGSINLIIAQRLVRRVCSACHGKGCSQCQQTGFKGRIPIVEALKPSHEFNELIAKKASVEEFELKAKALGMKTMLEDGLEKARLGLTTRQEIARVTKK